MATCSIADLIDQACANKFTCLADERIAQAVILQLLCNISEAGGGAAVWGGITGTLSDQTDLQAALDAISSTTPAAGAVDPEGAVTGSPGKTYFNTAALSFWVKASGVGNVGWQQLV